MESAHEIGLGLRHVEGKPIGLREDPDKEEEGAQRAGNEEPHRVLGLHHATQAQPGVGSWGVHPEKNRENGEPERQLVGNHLGRAADSPKEGIFTVRAPPCEHDPVHREGTDREDEDHPEIHRGQHQRNHLSGQRAGVLTERDHRDDREGRDEGDEGGRPEEGAIHIGRGEVLLEEELEPVRRELDDPEPGKKRPDHGNRPDEGGRRSVRADPAVLVGGNLPLDENRVAGNREDDDQHDGRVENLQEERDKFHGFSG